MNLDVQKSIDLSAIVKKPYCLLLAMVGLAITSVATAQDVAEQTVNSAVSDDIKRIYGAADAPNIQNMPIGVFDSGTGGLTVLEKILTIDAFENQTNQLTPSGDGKPDFANESFIFLADQANMPYGNYPVVGKEEFLEELIVKDAWFLMGQKRFRLDDSGESGERYTEVKKASVKAIVIACNTATAYGQDDIEKVIDDAGLDVKVVGVIDAGAKGAVESLKGEDGTIGVVPTRGTVLSGAYPIAIRRIADSSGQAQRIEVIQQGAFGLAGAIDGAAEFILPDPKNNNARNDYRGPSMTHPEVTIRQDILNRYDFDFRGNRMLYRDSQQKPSELQLNSVDNYIAFHLVSLMEQFRTDESLPPLRAIILGCTHFPFYKDVFDKELERLRNYQEGDEFIYRKHMAKKIELIDPAYFTARELYQSLAADARVRPIGNTPRTRGEFCITVACQDGKDVQLNASGDFTYEFKYGRNPGKVTSNFRAVSLDARTVDESVLQRLQKHVPNVWTLMKKDAHQRTISDESDTKE